MKIFSLLIDGLSKETEKEAVSLVETTFVDKKEIYGGEVERGETFRPEKM